MFLGRPKCYGVRVAPPPPFFTSRKAAGFVLAAPTVYVSFDMRTWNVLVGSDIGCTAWPMWLARTGPMLLDHILLVKDDKILAHFFVKEFRHFDLLHFGHAAEHKQLTCVQHGYQARWRGCL